MSLSDPIGDMLARIKNSQMRNHKKVEIPSSNFKAKIADVLKNEGYINNFNVENNNNKNILIIDLKSSTFRLVGILKYLSSSELIWLTKGSVILPYGSIIIETTYSIHSSQLCFSNHKYNLLKG